MKRCLLRVYATLLKQREIVDRAKINWCTTNFAT